MSPDIITSSEMEELKPITIGIMGPVGVGKSTIARALGERTGVTPTVEDFGENPYLAGFYHNPKEFAFRSQIWFLERKFDQLKNLNGSGHIYDPAIEMDRLYALTQHKIGWISKPEWDVYKDFYKTLVEQDRVKKPDIFFVLTAPTPIIEARIRGRGRPPEIGFLDSRKRDRLGYFSALHNQVISWYDKKLTDPDFPPVVKMDTHFVHCQSQEEINVMVIWDVKNWLRYYQARGELKGVEIPAGIIK